MSGSVAGWPVKLAHIVPRKSGAPPKRKPTGKPKPAVVQAAEVITAAAEAEEDAAYYHKRAMSKEEAGELVIGAGTGDGTYLVYDHASKGRVLCVVYKGKPTHHLITEEDGKVLINKKPCVNPQTVSDVLAATYKRARQLILSCCCKKENVTWPQMRLWGDNAVLGEAIL